jgi:MFS family permease
MNIPKQTHLDRIATNIPKYFVYTALKGFGFGLFAATWVIYMQQARGLSLSQAALVDVTFFVAAAFGEVPTGMVADTLGRKKSLIIGSMLLTLGLLGWTFAPSLSLILIAYVAMGIGMTFLSGADDAFFYESVQLAGRGGEYARLVGKAGAIFPGALAFGSVASGILASFNLIWPFLASSLVLLIAVVIVLTFHESRIEEKVKEQPRPSYREVLGQAITLMRTRPILLYGMLYLALVPLASFMIEAVFLQPQALALSVPIAGIGVIAMAAQFTGVLGSSWADRLKNRFGENRILYTAPVIIISCLLALAIFQVFPALLFIGVMGFFTAILRPLMLSHIQKEVPDNIRATIISLQSLMFTIVAAVCQPTLGLVADQAGLPVAYFALAGGLGLGLVILLWKSRRHFAGMSQPAVGKPLTAAQFSESPSL